MRFFTLYSGKGIQSLPRGIMEALAVTASFCAGILNLL
jgi:hypothetical protein